MSQIDTGVSLMKKQEYLSQRKYSSKDFGFKKAGKNSGQDFFAM